MNDISVDEREDIANALDAGKMITPESTRRVLSQHEIDKIVDAYNGLKATESVLQELLETAEKLNASEDTKTQFTLRCAEVFPQILQTMNSLR